MSSQINDLGTLELSDILDSAAMQSLMDELHGITGMCSGIADIKGNILASVGWRDICALFHRAHPETMRNCKESDTILSSGVAPGDFKLYRCKNNIWEAASPIVIAGQHLGNIFFGQYFYDDEVVDAEHFRAQAQRYGFDEEKYLAAMDRVPRYSRETVEHAIRFHAKLAKMISTLSYNNTLLSSALSERKQAVEALRVSEEQARLMSDLVINSDQPVAVGFLDGCLDRFNPAFCELTGYSEEELLAIDWTTELTPSEWRPAEREALSEIERNGKPVRYEKEYIRKDGTRVPIELFAHLARDAAGDPKYYYAFISDITERKQAEVNLRESEAKYRHLFSTMTQGVVIQDADGKIIEANQAACNILGLTMDQMYGKTAYDSRWKLIHEDGSLFDPAEMPSNIALRTGKPSNNVICGIYVPEVDKYRWTLIVSVPRFHAGEPKPFVTITVFIDITERKKLETQMLQAQKLESIGTLAGGIAHDFNNILSSIIGFTELALDEVKKDTTLDDSLQEVYRAGNRAKDLVKQILAFARQSEEKLKPIQPRIIAKEVLKFIRSTIPTTIEIKQSLDSDSLIMGNATQVHQVLMNLCTNAAHAMEDQGGMLEVSLKDVTADRIIGTNKANLKHNDYIELMVSDTGEGIAPDIISSIFEPYFTTKDPGEGTGMGLAMVQGIVDTYGGHISVDSKMGKGSIFKLYFPITRKRKAQRVYVQKELPRGTERVLFVDDEAPITKIGSRILERLGYTVTTRTSSIEAMELLRSKPNAFDLVVTDMTMPNITGDQLAIELLKICPDIPIILCTGYSNKISEETALEIGIKAFVYKPIVKADLAQTVRKVLDEAIF